MKSDLPDRTFAFAERIVRLCLALESDSSVAATLMRQLLRSGTSIGAN
ncbi:four helix bundle protein, partial [Stieleria mannarensis]